MIKRQTIYLSKKKAPGAKLDWRRQTTAELAASHLYSTLK
jgi:hypothetical protein